MSLKWYCFGSTLGTHRYVRSVKRICKVLDIPYCNGNFMKGNDGSAIYVEATSVRKANIYVRCNPIWVNSILDYNYGSITTQVCNMFTHTAFECKNPCPQYSD